MIEIESTTLAYDDKVLGLDSAYEATGKDWLVALETPLYSSEEDAVLAFKQEAMPLTLDTENEHSAYLETVEVVDKDTGKVQTYYYFADVYEGGKDNVAFRAIVGRKSSDDYKLLMHTHPVDGGWSRNFSGDPEVFAAGDTMVPDFLEYDGIYVVGSGAEVKLLGGPGTTSIGSGQNTHANTKEELAMVSIVDLY